MRKRGMWVALSVLVLLAMSLQSFEWAPLSIHPEELLQSTEETSETLKTIQPFVEAKQEAHQTDTNATRNKPDFEPGSSDENAISATNQQTPTQSLAATPGQGDVAQKLFVEPAALLGAKNGILLRAGGINTDAGSITQAIPENLRFEPERVGSGEHIRYLVQFSGPVKQEWKKSIASLGGVLGDYIPNNSFIISLTRQQHEIVSSYPFVRWTEYFHPYFKLSEALSESDVLNKANRSTERDTSYDSSDELMPSNIPELTDEPNNENSVAPMNESQTILLTVQTFERGRLPYLHNLTELIGDCTVINESDTRKSRVVLEVSLEELEEVLILLAQAAEVEWIEPYVPPSFNNSEMVWVVQQNNPGSTGLWDKGLTGEGQVVGVGDTGLDIDMVFFWDPAQGVPHSTVNLNQRKVISYHDLAGNGDWDGHDHGTHVAGTIAGESTTVNTGFNGIAYDARLVIQDIGYGGSLVGIPGDLNTYFQQAYNDGARIHSNSWGSAVGGAYTSYSQDADEFMWNHKDFLIVFSAGNSGSEVNTIGAPGTAKNVITSGASENGHNGYDQANVAYFSSNGPTDDGRIKPTVTAPGHFISSADNDGTITSYNSSVRTMSGTSMSAPSHAGSAALIREYYMEGFYPTGIKTSVDSITPSAALIKATMVNSAVNMTGTYIDAPIPSTGQGWGRILLDNSLYFAGDDQLLYIEDEQAGLQTGENKSYTLFSDGQGVVKVTLVWTDHYPSLSGAVQLVNDLDLTVTNSQATYRGNVFSGGSSTTGGTSDRLNVVENVLLPDPVSGSYNITVSGANVPAGPQPYALVVTGLSRGSNKATLSLDKNSYRPDSTLTITLNDLDLNNEGQIDLATVHISTTGDGGQDISLTEITPNSGTFQSAFVINDLLTVNEGDTLTVQYNDEDNGQGLSETIEATATIDATAPAHPPGSGVVIHQVSRYSAVVSWQSVEPTTAILFYQKEGDGEWTQIESPLSQNHSIALEGLAASTLYRLKITMFDVAGNETHDDNHGIYYTFSTDMVKTLIHEDSEGETLLFQVTGGSNSAGENGLWHVTSFQANSGDSAWYYGLEATKTYDTGFWNWGHITSVSSIDLSGCSGAELHFNHILKTEEYSPFDTGKVEISEDNINFTTLYQSVKSSSDWEEVVLSLDSYIGKQIYIRFSFDTEDDLYNGYQGWLIDDIKVLTFHKRKGDINGDGIVDLTDNLLALKVMVGSTGTNNMMLEGDVDGDGRIGIAEAIQVMQSISEQP